MRRSAECPDGLSLGACRDVCTVVIDVLVAYYALDIVAILRVGLLKHKVRAY